MFITKTHSAPDVPSRRGSDAGAAAARSHDPRIHAAGADRGPSEEPLCRGFFSSRDGAGIWEPATEGALPTKLPYIMESLEKVRDQTVILSGLWSKSAEPPEGTTGSDHWVAAAFLTGIKPKKTAGSDATVGSPTIDQVIARKIGQDTLLPSLQLAVEDPNSSSSNCGEGYSCSYTNSISWVELPSTEDGLIAADEPAADGAQPAGRVRAPVRQRRHARRCGPRE